MIANYEVDEESIAAFLECNKDWSDYPDLVMSPPSKEEVLESYPDADMGLIARCYELIQPMITRGAFYFRMRMEGKSDKAAVMYALQKVPGAITDDTFFHGAKPLYEQFGSQMALDQILNASKKHGFVPDKNAIYFSNLARFRGDPEAYVSRSQGRTYIKRLLEKRGWACEGGIQVEGREPEKDMLAKENCKPLAEDIINSRAAKMISADPSLKRVNRKELRSRIIEKHGAKA